MKRKARAKDTADRRGKDFLTDTEMQRFLEAARQGRHGVRDYLLMLMAYRHGLRVSKLVDVRLRDIDLDTGRVYVRRKKGSFSTPSALGGR
jgi:integrase